MGLEQRGNGMYYYRKERRGKQVVSVYAGRGDFGTLFAALDRETRAERESIRQDERRARADVAHADKIIKELDDTLVVLVRAHLVTQGYHTHKGQWRREQKTRRTKKRGAS